MRALFPSANVIPVLVASALIVLVPVIIFLAYVAHASRHKKSSRRPLRLVGRVASVERALEPEGFVLVDGELWRARVRGGTKVEGLKTSVRVVGASGCMLEVEPLG